MNEIRPLIERQATRWGINPNLVEAVCMVESAMNPWATRFEPKWRWLLNPRNFARMVNTTERTEIIHQQTSWGLMQTMGTVARELGYVGPLPGLCDANESLFWGCKKLASLKRKYSTIAEAIEAYNAGRPGTDAGIRYRQKVVEQWKTL